MFSIRNVTIFAPCKDYYVHNVPVPLCTQYGNQKMGAFLMMLDYTVRHDDTTIHQIRITAENAKHHEKGENICYYQSPDFE